MAIPARKNGSKAGSSSWMDRCPDPTRVFSIIVVSIMLLRYLVSHEWNLSAIVSGFLINPYVVVFTATAVATVLLSPTSRPLSTGERWTAEWYWWNSFLYHAIMDGATGSFGLIPVVLQQYKVLDRRFTTHHVVPWLVGCVELFVMFPCCLACVWAIRTRHALRYPLEILTSTMHVFGMIMFVAAEVYEGQLNVPALDPVGVPGDAWANVQFFSVYHLTYYWFGFWFCNLVWGVVPLMRIITAMQQIASKIQQQQQQNGKEE